MSQTTESNTDASNEETTPVGHEKFTVADVANENAFYFDNHPDADDKLEKAQNAPGVDPELFPPGESPEFLQDDQVADGEDEETEVDNQEGRKQKDEDDEVTEPLSDDVEVVKVDPGPDPDDMDDLPERSVGDDPLTWMPGHFIDEIDGKQAINRKGFEVLAQHYNISTTAKLEVPPEETDYEYVRVKAHAETNDGRVCEAYGSAHVDRGDDPELLLEMADTRARKRALSIATGVGTVAVAELKNEVE